MRFRVTGSARDDSAIPEMLSTVEPLDPPGSDLEA
jgi:hypothetical protein